MSIEEENKAFVRRFCELENQGDLEKLYELLVPGIISHYGADTFNMEQLKQIWPNIWSAFPDIHFTMEDMIAEGNKVAFRESWTGTHEGEFMGIAPTGKKVKQINTCIVRIENGKFAESWCTIDNASLLQQLGAIPAQ